MREYSIRFSQYLDDDIANLVMYFSDLAGDIYGERLANEIYSTIESLKTMPEGHPMWQDDPTVRRINLKKRRVAIIYIVNNDKLEVIAAQVFHALSEPERIRAMVVERLEELK